MIQKFVIGVTGATGVIYGVRLLEVLKEIDEVESHLIMSAYGRMTLEIETDYTPKEVEALADVVHNPRDLTASVASGSFKSAGMIVAPCSMKTLSAIAHSYGESLIARAADVMLKERRRLVLMPRETPLHIGHLKLMVQASELGAIIVPPNPAFYNRPATLDDIINHSIGRVLDLFDIDSGLVGRWQGRQS